MSDGREQLGLGRRKQAGRSGSHVCRAVLGVEENGGMAGEREEDFVKHRSGGGSGEATCMPDVPLADGRALDGGSELAQQLGAAHGVSRMVAAGRVDG
jgi:hypothetical protein